MRMRKKKNGEKRMLACADIHITNPTEYKGKWRTLANEKTALYAEIGCGKGALSQSLHAAIRTPFILVSKKYRMSLLWLWKR